MRGIGPVGRVTFGPDTLHDLRSVTKSIIGLLYGAALAARKVPAPDAPLFAQFPRYADLVEADPRRKRLTIAHALTMTLGTAWDEATYPYSDPRNSETAMDLAADRYRYILGLAVTEEPGQRWLYSGGATALIGKIIVEGVGRSLVDFARTALFDPLGIGETAWAAGPNGEPFAASGLRMTPRDLARIGQLLLDKGQADGREVVPADWLAQSLIPRATIDEARRYGYHWYVGDVPVGASARRESWIGAFGNGGNGYGCCRPSISSSSPRPATTTGRISGSRRLACCARSCSRAWCDRQLSLSKSVITLMAVSTTSPTMPLSSESPAGSCFLRFASCCAASACASASSVLMTEPVGRGMDLPLWTPGWSREGDRKFMAALKTLAIVVLLGYAALVALMYVAQRSLMYFPDTTRVAPADVGLRTAEEVVLQADDGEALIAWHVPPRESRPVILYFQGNGGAVHHRVHVFEKLLARGFGLVALSYRGYGGSSGSPTEEGLIADARAAYDFAAARYPAERIALWGESLGGAVAIALAAERPVARIALQAPFSSAADVGAAHYPYLPVRWLIKDPFRSDERVGRITAPVLVVHGERDGVVPIRFGERLYARFTSPKRFVRLPRAGHNDLDAFGATEIILDFLAGQ